MQAYDREIAQWKKEDGHYLQLKNNKTEVTLRCPKAESVATVAIESPQDKRSAAVKKRDDWKSKKQVKVKPSQQIFFGSEAIPWGQEEFYWRRGILPSLAERVEWSNWKSLDTDYKVVRRMILVFTVDQTITINRSLMGEAHQSVLSR